MSEILINVEILFRSVEREVEGHDHFMGEAHQRAWRDLSRLASTKVYSDNSSKIAVSLDWSIVARRLIEISGRSKRRSPKHLRIRAEVSITGEEPLEAIPNRYAQFFVTYHLCNVFLAMNISAPGSADFVGVQVSSGDAFLDTELNLSAYDYDYAWTSSREGKWPPVKQIPLEACFDWLEPLERHVVQVASSDVERLLLSMLRVAQMDSSPDSAIWLCAGIEALFPTKYGSAQPRINEAIGNLLAASDEQKVDLRSIVREIYDLRNAFAHGNLPVAHPYSSEFIDERVSEEFDRYVDAHLDGVRILLACVQQLVLEST